MLDIFIASLKHLFSIEEVFMLVNVWPFEFSGDWLLDQQGH